MAELIPAPFPDLVRRLFLEPQRQNAIFELPRNRWFLPAPGGPDFSVNFHTHIAGNPLGPAAGPHTQMAQNILLSYVAGGRILELKTVQVNDRLTIPRPCIDMTNIGYNVEWSQELLVDQSLREYVAGSMLVHMFRFARPETGDVLHGPPGEVIYDTSVGYDLKGIQSDKVRAFLHGMRNAGPLIQELRKQIPAEFKAARELTYPTDLSDSITLSTFHGCPADEIEKISEFLIAEGFHVIVKMNPPMLGRERLEHLLHDVLGYRELTVNPEAYRTGLSFDEGVQLCNRLRTFAAQRKRGFGAKFSNTLEVVNHRDFFTPDNKVMYLSGQPLYVITLTLTDEFRKVMGPEFPISFSAGIDQHNFPHAVACGFVPITVSTDLLRPGGYGRMSGYLDGLANQMKKSNSQTIDEFILHRSQVRKVGIGEREPWPGYEEMFRLLGEPRKQSCLADSKLWNTALAVGFANNDPRYRADQNRKIPKRIDKHLVTFDCITCDKCLPVCPNAANFTYPTPKVAFDYHDIIISPDGSWRPGEKRHFEIKESMQIACYSDFCNECGNCDTFCPEYGGPYIKKPNFFGDFFAWKESSRDGFVVMHDSGLWGRIQGVCYFLYLDPTSDLISFADGVVDLHLDSRDTIKTVNLLEKPDSERQLDMWAYYSMRHLLSGIMNDSRINQVNAGKVDVETNQVFAIIPAAGHSRRMGRDKQLIEIDGRPMLRAVLETVSTAAVAGTILISRRKILDAIQLPQRIQAVLNEAEQSEMIDSIRIGIRTWRERQPIESDAGFLILPADQPGITTADVNACIDAFRESPTFIIIASNHGRRGHPMIFPAGLADFVLSPGCDSGLNSLQKSFPDCVQLVPCDSAGVTQDVDTLDDLQSL